MTTGGSTSGRCTSAVEQRLAPEAPARQQPGDRDAERQAPPRSRPAAIRRRQPDRGPFLGGEVSHSSSIDRRESRADVGRHQEREAVLLEHRLAPSPTAQESEKGGRVGVRRRRGRARPDRRSADASPPGTCRRSSRSARPRRRSRRRCRAAPRRARPAPARRARSRPARPCPRRAAQTPSFSSAALPYLPAGTALTSPIASRPSPTQLGEIEARRDRRRCDLAVLRRDQHQPVAEQVDARVGPGSASCSAA